MSHKKVFRHEFKYYINYFEHEVLRGRLKSLLGSDSFSDDSGEYHIRSLYFDDLSSSALYEKQAGILDREKYRIRIYNLSDKVIKLEKKSRVGQFIHKESARISRYEYDQISKGEYDFLLARNNSLLAQFYFSLKSCKLSPCVIVDYTREAYVLNINNIRITFDKKLSTGMNNLDIFCSNPTIDALEEPKLILEVKYDHFLPDYIRDVLQISSSQRFAISKYVICRKYIKMNNWEDN